MRRGFAGAEEERRAKSENRGKLRPIDEHVHDSDGGTRDRLTSLTSRTRFADASGVPVEDTDAGSLTSPS